MHKLILLLVVSVACSGKSLANVIVLSGEHSNIIAGNGKTNDSGITSTLSQTLLNTHDFIYYSEENATLVIHNLPIHSFGRNCNMYELCLYTNRRALSSTESSSLDCSDQDLFSYRHSPCKTSSHNSQTPGSCSIEQYFDDTLDITGKSVTFSHVSKGFYCVQLKCWAKVGVSSRNLSRHPFRVESKAFVDDDHDASCWNIVPKLFPGSDQVEVRLIVKSPCSRKDLQFVLNLENKAVGKTSVNNACNTVTVQDQYHEASHTFTNLASGNYSLQILAVDPRCGGDPKKLECTQRIEDIIVIGHSPEVTVELPNIQERCCQPKDYVLVGLMCVVVLVFIIVAIIGYTRKMWCFRPRTDESGLLQHDTSVVKIRKTVPVLLLHANDDEALRKQVYHFCRVLNSIGFCEVSDIFDNRIYDAIATHGESFISAMLSDPKVQVVVVTSKRAVRAQKSILGGVELEDENSGSMFELYVKALKTVMIMVSGNVASYKRIHLVRFSDITPSDDTLSFITPFRCYIIPRNLRNLLCHLHGFADQDVFEWDNKLGEDFCRAWSNVTCAELCTNRESLFNLLAAC